MKQHEHTTINLKLIRKAKINHSLNIGKKFNRLTVVDVVKYTKYIKYKCLCDCGHNTEAYSFAVMHGTTKSCGCYFTERSKEPKNKARSDIKTGLYSSAANAVWLTYKRNSMSRGHEFSLDKPYFLNLIVKNCHYCGIAACQTKKIKNKKSPEFRYNGIDRKNNNLGYTIDNSIPCCFICNRAKGQLSYEEFTSWTKLLNKKGWK